MAPNGPGGSSAEDDDPLPEDGVRRDLRVSKHEDLGVEVRRDLTSQGWLARGSNTRMSKLSFHMGAVPRDYKDPELEALSQPAAPRPSPEVVARPANVPPAVEPPADAPPAAPPSARGTVARLFGKLFGRDKNA
jgi:hypothetical protein